MNLPTQTKRNWSWRTGSPDSINYRLRPKAFEELVSYLQKLAEDARS